MNVLKNKRVLLGISGGIAAYKSAELVRRLQDHGAEVRIVMTKSALEFVKPLTFQALSSFPVHTDLLDTDAEAAMGHIELARWADVFLIAPATANTIAQIVRGEAIDLLTTVVLASKAPLLIAPAMNQAMWSNIATQDNIQVLKDRGIKVLGPASGSQACGDVGEGRLLEVSDIISQLNQTFIHEKLAGQHIVITAGPTREAIDPVRFISNHSSGKMGYALAQAALEAGAAVTLITGPTDLAAPERAKTIQVESAVQMHQQAMQACETATLFIACAAVADYRPVSSMAHKLKKSADKMQIEFVKNPDILADISATYAALFTVGFAAETENMQTHAQSKLNSKQLNMIIANDVSASSAGGFNSDMNAVDVFAKQGQTITQTSFDLRSKNVLATDLIALIAEHYQATLPYEKTSTAS